MLGIRLLNLVNPHVLKYQVFDFLVLYVFANLQLPRYNLYMPLRWFLIAVRLNHIFQTIYHSHLTQQREASPSKPHLDGASITGSAFQPLPGIDSFSHHTV